MLFVVLQDGDGGGVPFDYAQGRLPTPFGWRLTSLRMTAQKSTFVRVSEQQFQEHDSRGEPVVEHEVDEDTSDRDVQPEREGPAGNGAMAVEALAQGSGQGDDHQGNDDHRKSYMRDQNCEVDGTRPACSLKVYRSDMGVVVKI